MTGIVEEWPVQVITLSGGTRNTVGLDRPWQKEIAIEEKSCPYCAEERPDADRSLVLSVHDQGDSGRWKVRKNKVTPYPFHRLIVPLVCYSHQALWELGGEENIAGALYTAREVMWGIGTAKGEEIPDDIFFYVHVGYSAGQRWGHEHWHFTEPPRAPSITEDDLADIAARQELVVSSAKRFTIVAGGCRAGQCYIIPDYDWRNGFLGEQINALAHEVHHLVTLFNQKFLSAEGLKPDFEVFMRFKEKNLVYAKYIPILNMWGASEYAAIDELTPFVLPWPHEATVEHLLS